MVYLTESYRNQLSEVHSGIFPWGGAVEGSVPRILEHASQLGCKTILDYGSGYGCFKQTAEKIPHNFIITEYEPAFPDKANLPEPADYVICVDVLEHVEPELIDNVLQHLWSLTKKAGYFAICTVPALSNLPDGRNKHLIIEPAEWWFAKLDTLFDYEITLRSGAHIKMVVYPKVIKEV